MSTEVTREIAQKWIDYVKENHYEKTDALAAPDATWWVDGLKEKIPIAGDMSYVDRRKQTGELNAKADVSTTDVVSLTADGEVAVLEVYRTLKGPGEKSYENYAIVKLVVKDGKIQEVREYIDFFALYKYLGVPGF